MGEQEKYARMLKKLIDDTESSRIQTMEELIQQLINELTNTNKEELRTHA
ncbi:hypothetical protein [Oceanobacillus damuensis]|nr:hypothetical protein [Oceanobacillus damuensis]